MSEEVNYITYVTDLEKQQPVLKKKTLTQKQLKLKNFQLGLQGERLACKYLLKNNFKILAQNIRIKNNEVDIIALDKKYLELVFIEVKTRSSAKFGLPTQAVDNKKMRSMQQVATAYMRLNRKLLQRLGCADSFRFDIIAILYEEQRRNTSTHIQHFESITWP